MQRRHEEIAEQELQRRSQRPYFFGRLFYSYTPPPPPILNLTFPKGMKVPPPEPPAPPPTIGYHTRWYILLKKVNLGENLVKYEVPNYEEFDAIYEQAFEQLTDFDIWDDYRLEAPTHINVNTPDGRLRDEFHMYSNTLFINNGFTEDRLPLVFHAQNEEILNRLVRLETEHRTPDNNPLVWCQVDYILSEPELMFKEDEDDSRKNKRNKNMMLSLDEDSGVVDNRQKGRLISQISKFLTFQGLNPENSKEIVPGANFPVKINIMNVDKNPYRETGIVRLNANRFLALILLDDPNEMGNSLFSQLPIWENAGESFYRGTFLKDLKEYIITTLERQITRKIERRRAFLADEDMVEPPTNEELIADYILVYSDPTTKFFNSTLPITEESLKYNTCNIQKMCVINVFPLTNDREEETDDEDEEEEEEEEEEDI